MPKVGQKVLKKAGVGEEALSLAPYFAHGLDLTVKGDNANGPCPFCGKEDGKFGVKLESGEFNCFSCGARGNAATFLRKLWEESDKFTKDWSVLSSERKFADEATPMYWGCCRSIVDGSWLLPGWGVGGKLDQLYQLKRVTDKKGKWVNKLLPTPGIDLQGHHHALFGVNLFDHAKEEVWLCEGPWDGMALWETLKAAKATADGLRFTDDPEQSLLANVNVVATPGANVFFEQWLPLFKDKRVTLCFDNDHPIINQLTGAASDGAGISGMRRVARLLLASTHPPKDVRFLCWNGGADAGTVHHDVSLKSGWDVRDHLTTVEGMVNRMPLLEALLAKFTDVPEAWRADLPKPGERAKLEPLPCHSWEVLQAAWGRALRWRQGLDDVLSVMLAVALSTEQIGDQLFLMVIGDAGSAKSRLCQGMMVSKKCKQLLNLTGFHSGFKDASGKDFSLVKRIDKKTLITPEADVVMSSPHFDEIMSQQRQLYDGSTSAIYKNSDEDREESGLRTTWIMAGTPAMLDKDQARLGDRFLHVRMDVPDDDEKRHILRRVAESAWASVVQTSNGHAEGQVERCLAEAHRLTGGYVNHLRANAADLLSAVSTRNKLAVFDRCSLLANFVADMRASPNQDLRKDTEATKELPSRLTHQLVRLAVCLAAVLNRDAVDEEVLRRIKKVALDTARGKNLEMVRHLADLADEQGEDAGATTSSLAMWSSLSEDKAKHRLSFLRQVDVVRVVGSVEVRGRVKLEMGERLRRWALTPRMRLLYNGVMNS